MQLGNYKSLLRLFRGNAKVLFGVIFLALLVGEGFVLKRSFDIISASQKNPIDLKQTQGVRINFSTYNDVVNRLNTAQNYQATTTPLPNPFIIQSQQ